MQNSEGVTGWEWKALRGRLERSQRPAAAVMLVSVLAGAIPLVQLPEGGFRSRAGMLAWTSVLAFLYWLFRGIGKIRPDLREWALHSLAGIASLSFLASATATSIALTVGLMQFPAWFILLFACCLIVAAVAVVSAWRDR